MKSHLLFAALLVLSATNAQGQPGGSLDDTFGVQGHTQADLSAQNRYDEAATEVLLQADGKRVVVVDRYPYLHLIRFNADGTYDATFGEGGFSQTARIGKFGGPNSNAAIQADGKIVVVGETDWNETTMTDFGIARWNTNGTLDAGFGTQGIVVTDFGLYWEEAEMVRVLPDGKLLVAGTVRINNVSYIGLARYTSGGSLDPTFGVGGKYVNVSDVDPIDMGLLPDGKLMVLGDPQGPHDPGDFALVRFNANGFIDTSFGTLGYTVYDVDFGSYDPWVRCLAIQPDGKLLLGGQLYNGVNSDMLVMRYTGAGSPDNTFHGDGVQTTHIGGTESVRELAVQPDGRIVAVGDVYYGGSQPTAFALARYTAAGNLDATFGVQGTQLTTFAGYDGAYALAVAIHPDGDVTAAGAAYKNNSADVAIATYDVQGPGDVDGHPVQSIAAFYADVGATYLLASAVQVDGKLVAAGYAWNGVDYDMIVARFNTDGSPDASFGTGGHTKADFSGVQVGSGDESARSIAIQPDGKIVVSGSFFGFTVNGSLPVARLNPDGSLDATFGTGGLRTHDLPGVFEDGNALVVQPDGKIVIGGSVNLADWDMMLCRLNPDGSLDAGFGTGGVVTTHYGYQDMIFGLALRADGKFVATGNTSLPASFDGFDFCTVRYNPDGSVDTGFGTGGRVTTDFDDKSDFAEAIALQPDGAILVAGGVIVGQAYKFAVARYSEDGAPDASFGGGAPTLGLLGSDVANAVAVQSDGRILLAGVANVPGDDYFTEVTDFGLARYTSAGVPDAEFGTAGEVTSHFNGQEWAYSIGLFHRRIYVTGLRREFREFTRTDKLVGIVAAYVTGPTPPDELIEDIIDDIDDLPGVPAGTKQSLKSKLQAALNALAAGDTARACQHVEVFMQFVDTQSGKKLTPAQATQLLAEAADLMTAMNCANQGPHLRADETTPAALDEPEVDPLGFALLRNSPNPFDGSTRFSYQLPAATRVSLEVYNVQGRVVAKLVDENQSAGLKSVRWDASSQPSGVYYYRLKAGSFTATRKMLLMR